MESVDAKPPASKAKRILVVDDEPNILRLIARSLERHGYEVDTAENGLVALAKIQVSKPDLLITDVRMPEMDGYELFTEIRGDSTLADLLIVLMTGKGNDGPLPKINGSKTFGITRFLTKPFYPSELIHIVDKILFAARVLAVDDSLTIVHCIYNILEHDGYQVETAESGREALARMKLWQPDLLITDWKMPEMDGPELIERVRSIPALKDLPALLLTAWPADKPFLASDFFGARICHKPLNPIELGKIVKDMLRPT